MKKKKLLYYWGAVDAVTKNLKDPSKNEWAKENATSFEYYQCGVDEVVLYNTPSETVVAINGSDKDKGEWRGNFNGYPIVDGMHHNFRKQGIHILLRLLRDIPKAKRVIVVGHSRGGALAQVFTHYAVNKHGLMAYCVTYGSPRVFTLKRCNQMRFTHDRVNTNGDPVCHIPPVFFPPFFKSYQTINHRIKTGRILGWKKKHGNYQMMLEKYYHD